MDVHALWPEDVQIRAYRIEKILESLRVERKDLSAARAEILQQFHRCASDSERLWLSDLLAPESDRWATLFIDDAGFPASSPAAAVVMTRPLHEYNVYNGVVFEAGQPEKTRFLMDNVPDAVMSACQSAIKDTILGGSPSVVAATRMLGLPLAATQGLWENRGKAGAIAAANREDASRISSAVMVKGSIALRGACSAAAGCSWPLVARKFYLSRAECKVAFAAPVAIADQKFGLKMKIVQLRWAIAVLLGRPAGLGMPSVSSITAARLLNDLGWQSLWASMAASAISMYNAIIMTCQALHTHRQLASQTPPQAHGWMRCAV